MSQVPELSPTQFVERWPDWPESGSVVLLDVREPTEVRLAAVAGAVRVPMNDVPARAEALEKATPLVVMCHSGARSRRVAEFLSGRGFREVANLSGGIDAWSRQIDPDVPRY